MIAILVWIGISSFIANIQYYSQTGSLMVLQENIVIKSFKTSMYWIDLLCLSIILINLIKSLSLKQIFRPYVCAYFFLFAILIIELFSMPHAFLWYHVNAFTGTYNRIRLTTTESSLTVPLILCFGTMTLYYYKYIVKNTYGLIISIICMMIFMVTSSSKTLFLVLFVMLVYVIWCKRKKSIQKLSVFLPLGIIFLLIVLSILLIFLEIGISNTPASTGVRLVQILSGIVHIIKYPFGNGGGTYIYSFKSIYVEVYKWLSSTDFGKTLGYYEVLMTIRSKDQNGATVIAGIWIMMLYLGWTGVVCWLWQTVKYLRQFFKERIVGSLLLRCTIISIFTMWFCTTAIYNLYYAWAIIITCGSRHFIKKLLEKEP